MGKFRSKRFKVKEFEVINCYNYDYESYYYKYYKNNVRDFENSRLSFDDLADNLYTYINKSKWGWKKRAYFPPKVKIRKSVEEVLDRMLDDIRSYGLCVTKAFSYDTCGQTRFSFYIYYRNDIDRGKEIEFEYKDCYIRLYNSEDATYTYMFNIWDYADNQFLLDRVLIKELRKTVKYCKDDYFSTSFRLKCKKNY